LGTDRYIIKSMATASARLPERPVHLPLTVIEALIVLGYFRPTDGPGSVTYLHPTTDALLLADASTQAAYRPVFHRRYQRLRRMRA